jgi:hypothetical protein
VLYYLNEDNKDEKKSEPDQKAETGEQIKAREFFYRVRCRFILDGGKERKVVDLYHQRELTGGSEA